jgi:oligosaccharide repeat unit polymerase
MSWEIVFVSLVMLSLVNYFFDLKNLLNPFVFFYLYQTVFCFIALSYNDLLYPDIEISNQLRAYIIMAYILTFIGALASRMMFSKSGTPYIRVNQIYIEKRPSRTFNYSASIIFVLGVLAFIYFTFKTDGFIVFAEDIENERISRKAGAGLSNLIFVAFLLYGYAAILLNQTRMPLVKVILFFFTAFALVSYGSRAPLLKLMVAVFLILNILSAKKITLGKLFRIGAVLLVILAVLEAYRSNLGSPDASFIKLSMLRLGWRPFVNIQNLQRIYDFFPAQSGFMYGGSYLIDFKLFLPGSHPNFGTYLKDLMNWEFEGGSITTTFIGLGYINFGKAAFFIYPFLYGFVFNSVYQLFISERKVKNINLLFLLFFSIGVSGSVSTGLWGTLINNILFLVVALIAHLAIKQMLLKRPLILRLE